MKAGFIITLFALALTNQLLAQEKCSSFPYLQEELQKDPSLAQRINSIETFTRQQIIQDHTTARTEIMVIKIPVVVHILYHDPSQKISDAQVLSQIKALNDCYRRRNADTVKTPAVFRPIAADCEIEFQLAISDPNRRSTSGIIRKYTPITKWEMNDNMKFAAQMGDDAWDPRSYLNIWVCHLDRLAGYSSFPGGTDSKDGVVIDFGAFGTFNSETGYNMGKTAVHEVGHWLNLKHLWGDANCGDDGVDDTPKQASYTSGCPSGIRITCGNAPNGDMYMNYMDFTSDPCTNLFTNGQKARMRALFAPGGPRNAILSSKGLDMPLVFESPLPDDSPQWLHPQLYPNPAITEMTLDLAYDVRWLGKNILVTNLQGQTVMQVSVTSKNQRIDISKLQAGMYFLAAKKDDGESMKMKFIKL